MPLPAAKTHALWGAAFGLTFPLAGTFLQCWLDFGRIDPAGLLLVQIRHPALWIIDTLPLILGLFAYLAGARQEEITTINRTLQEQVRAQTQDLLATNAALRREIEVRVAREGELVEAYEEATAGTRAKDKFISSVSHELRTPLNGIIGMTDELLHTPISADQRESLSILRYSANNLLVIINDMLDLAKAAANKLELNPRDFVPAELLQSVQAAVRGKVAEKNIAFETRLVDPLPPVLHGDPVRLYQILLNLVGNAVKFTHEGGVTLEISTPVRSATSCELEVRVRDTGIGISEEHKQAIFDDFAQAHADIAVKYGGTGLGLAITRKLVELHGGSLSFESTPGQGSVFLFRITLPIGQHRPAVDSTDPHGIIETNTTPRPAATTDELQVDMRVLLVEDHPVNQVVATAFLKRYGFPYDLAENGRQAVEMAEARPYDFVLMDIHLPEMDGLEATRRIRASDTPHARNTRIIALTASALKEEAQACLDAGMDAFIAKPFKPKDLYRTIIEVMRKPATGAH